MMEINPGDANMLMQRALLYEGMEKYKLGVEDLRRVTQLDPSNRTAVVLLNRLTQAAANS